MTYKLDVLRYGKWEPRGSYPSVLEAQAHAPRGQYRIVEDVPVVEIPTMTVTQTITAGANFTVEAVEAAFDKALEAIVPKKRAARKPKADGSKKRAVHNP